MSLNSQTADDIHTSYVAPPLSRRVIRDVVKFFHDLWDELVPEQKGSFDILLFIDAIYPRLDEEFKLISKTQEEMGDYLGLTIPGENQVWIREDIYRKAQNRETESEMVCAHEFGHYVLHGNLKYPKKADASTPDACLAESQADAFAEELLRMPPNQLSLFENL